MAAENVVAVKVVHCVIHAADPTELVLALRADHVIAATVFLFHDQAALGAVGYLSFVFEAFKINFHSII